MKRTKRQENWIVIHFTFFLILFLGLIFYFISSVFPSIREIEIKKNSSVEIYNSLGKIEKDGLTLWEFKKNVNETVLKTMTWSKFDSVYLQEILKELKPNFYNEFFKNNTKLSYDEFISNLSSSDTEKLEFKKKQAIIYNILPIYSESFSDEEIETLTDYKFINYIESIWETFNINFNNPIWIKNVVLLDDFSTWIGDSSLETNIYYIPLNLDISWTKKSILEFLYFIENVWNLKIEEDNIFINNEIDDDFLSFKNRVLKGQRKTKEYNIFNNQIIDISSIEFTDYIDSSFDNTEKEANLIAYIKNNQWEEEYKVNVSLEFYVKGIPMYKLEEYIKAFLARYLEMNTAVNKELKNTDISWIKRGKLIKISNTLKQLWSRTINDIEKSLDTKKDIEKVYNQAQEFNKVFDEYLIEINK